MGPQASRLQAGAEERAGETPAAREAVDLEEWRKGVFREVVSVLADEAAQRRAWSGKGPEISRPDEEFCMFFDDAAAGELLARKDNGFTPQQQEVAQRFYGLMSRLSDATPKHIRAEDLIDDPRWIEVRKAAAAPLALLQAASA